MWRRVGCIALIVAVIGVVVAVVIQQTRGDGGFRLGSRNAKTEDSTEDKPNFEAARMGDLTIVVDATGSTEPITDIEVKSEATGQITEFYVEEGDIVKEGDLICKLDQSNQVLVVQAREIRLKQAQLAYNEALQATSVTAQSSAEAAVTGAQANLNSAQEAFVNAQSAYDRIAELHAKGYATDQELESASQNLTAAQSALDTAESSLADAKLKLDSYEATSKEHSIEQARLDLDSARVALAEAKKQLGDSEISSPISGIILEKLLDVGDSVVSINSAFSGGNTIVKVADLSRIQVRTSVDEIDIGKIEIGQSATVTVDAYMDREFEGTVTNRFPQGVSSGSGLISFIIMVEVDNSEGLLLGNMTSSVKIKAQEIKDVLLIPLSATRAGEEPDTTVVYVLKEGEDPDDPKAKTEERTVKVGDTDFYDVVVLDGLEEGEMVKVRGFENRIQFE
jgi:RND family efflux transporter MFP subunit